MCKQIGVTVDGDGIITEIEFVGGCDGNTHGLQNLILGMTKDEVIQKLEAGEEIEEKTIVMDEKGFDATTITQDDVDQYGI